MTTVGANVLTYTATGLSPGQHTVTVTAVNAVGESALSAAQTFTVIAAGGSGGGSTITAPSAPIIGTATAGSAGSGTASVQFNPPTSNGGAGISLYTVTASSGQVGTGTGSPIGVSGLPSGTPVTFTVKAYNGTYTSAASASSNPVTVPAAVVAGTSGTNLLIPAYASFTGAASGWVAGGPANLPTLSSGSNSLIARSNQTGGYYIQPTAGNYTPVTAGTVCSALLTATPSGSGVTCAAQINWYANNTDTPYSSISYSLGVATACPQGASTQLAVTATAPAGAKWMTIQLCTVADPTSGDTVAFSQAGLFAKGGVTTWSAGTAPSLPGTPTITTVTPSAGSASVAFTAPTSGGVPTSYTVTATSAGAAGVGVPTITSTSVGANSATINWSAVSGATGYFVARDGVDQSGNTYNTTVSSTTQTFTMTALTSGTTYHLSVAAVTSAGTGTAASAALIPQ